jgi:hypothetical protein
LEQKGKCAAFLSNKKSQHFAHGKILTFLEYCYKIVQLRGGMYELRRLYFHLRKSKKQGIRIRELLSPRRITKALPDTTNIRKISQEPALRIEGRLLRGFCSQAIIA